MLMVVAFIGITAVTIYSSIRDGVYDSATTAAATNAINNFSDNFYEGTDIASNIPIVVAAGLILSVIMAFTLYVRA